MVCVCVPFLILLILLQDRSVSNAVRNFHDRLKVRVVQLGLRVLRRGNGENTDGPNAAAAAGTETSAAVHGGRAQKRRRRGPGMPGQGGSTVGVSSFPIDVDSGDRKDGVVETREDRAAWEWFTC